jgi:hypothetical protein
MYVSVEMVVVFNDGLNTSLDLSGALMAWAGMALGPSLFTSCRAEGDRCFGGLSYTGIGIALSPRGASGLFV